MPAHVQPRLPVVGIGPVWRKRDGAIKERFGARKIPQAVVALSITVGNVRRRWVELPSFLIVAQRSTKIALPGAERRPSLEDIALVGPARGRNPEFPQGALVIPETQPVVGPQGMVCLRQIGVQL